MDKVAEEIKVFNELGLKNQVSMREIQKEIDGMEYYPVSTGDLERLFGFGRLRILCWWANQVAATKEHPVATFFLVALTLLPFALAATAAYIHHAHSQPGAWMLMSLSMLSLFAIIANQERETRTEIRLKLEIEPIGSTSIRIPYGAALRYKEAKDKGLFESFAVAYPNVVKEQIARDPAIVGIKRVGVGEYGEPRKQMFMVVFWDIEKDQEKDQEKAIKKIRDFQKFKVAA